MTSLTSAMNGVRGRAGKMKRVFRKAVARARTDSIQFQSGLGDSSEILYGLARSMKPQICVEIGSARGKSACAVGMALRENGFGRLYAIDPHLPTEWNDSRSIETYDILRRNIRTLNLGAHIEIVRSYSAEVACTWTRPIDLIFIDGDHSYQGVKRDWELFVPHVKQFGVVVFHDTIWDLRPDLQWGRSDMGVPRFVDELRRQGYPVLTIDKDCGVTLVQPRIGGVPLSLPG
jgi:predicted O-methyltransferase YrrM